MYRSFSIALILGGLLVAASPLLADDKADAQPAAKAAAKADAKKPGVPTREARGADVVYVPTPNDVVLKMLDLAKVGKDDVIYDLGCGDGRIVVLAAKRYGCHGLGVDIDPQRIKECHQNAKKYGVEKLVKFAQENIFKLDLSETSVVTMYLLPELNIRLIPQLDKLKDGSRIVTHEYDIGGVTPDKVVHHQSQEDGVKHTLYLYTTPLKKEKKAEKEKDEK